MGWLIAGLSLAQAQLIHSTYSMDTDVTNELVTASTSGPGYGQVLPDVFLNAPAPGSYKAGGTGWVKFRPLAKKSIGAGASVTSLGEQLASHMSYPNVLRRGNHGSIVVITFSISEDERLCRLRVRTQNQELNEEIIRQLVGRRLRLADTVPAAMDTYIIRLHFVP